MKIKHMFFVAIIFTTIFFSSCLKEISEEVASQTPVPVTIALSAAGSNLLVANQTLTFSATGGVSPYTYSVASGDGSMGASTGIFTAAATIGIASIVVTDVQGNTASAEITSLGAPGLWLKADTGVTSNSGLVSAWADQSGNANDFTQSTVSMQPTLSTYNSFASVYFNGTTNGLAKTGITNLNLAADSSVFFVVQTPGCDAASSNVQNTFLFQGSGSATPGTYFSSVYCPNAAASDGTLGISRPWGPGGAESTSIVGYGTGSPLERGTVFSTIVDASVGNYFIDGTSAGIAGNIATGVSENITTIGFIVNGGGVSSNAGSNDYYLKGNILEVIAYPTAQTGKRSIIECYLSKKYTLAIPGC